MDKCVDTELSVFGCAELRDSLESRRKIFVGMKLFTVLISHGPGAGSGINRHPAVVASIWLEVLTTSAYADPEHRVRPFWH